MGLESNIERLVSAYAVKLGYIERKYKSAVRGVPDHLYMSPRGVTIYMEFKAPNKHLNDQQAREINRMLANNVPVFVVDNFPRGCEILNEWEWRTLL